ncbi:MAG: PEP-CTERM sorting domain-containing protein [Rhodopila sp.]
MRLYRILAAGSLLALGLGWSGQVSATTIDKTLTVNVYQVCSDTGTNCASTGPAGDTYFAAEVNKIWAQAGISVAFDFVRQIDSSAFSNINDSSTSHRFQDLAYAYGTGPSATNVDMFLVHSVVGAYGEGWFGWGGLVIAMDDVMTFNGGIGRIDTIAHELGHNLGLMPDNLSGSDGQGHSTIPQELMASGGIRSIPASLADIAPSGLGLDLLSAGEIAIVRQSSLLHDIPEPATCLLLLGAVGTIAGSRRRRGHPSPMAEAPGL